MAIQSNDHQRRKSDLIAALDLVPMTTRQLMEFSETFDMPFKDESTLRHYLSSLRSARGGSLIQSFPYAIESDGRPPVYWKLTRSGYRWLFGNETKMPGRRYFEKIGRTNHEHTKAIAEFVVKTLVCAHREGFVVVEYRRENAFRIETPSGRPLLADGMLVLRDKNDGHHRFVLELDNGTERIQSSLDTESIQRKIEGYDQHQAQYDSLDSNRYFVLFVTTRSKIRVEHILHLAKTRMKTPERSVFLATDLRSYLACSNPFTLPCFVDNTDRQRPLVRPQRHMSPKTSSVKDRCVTPRLALC